MTDKSAEEQARAIARKVISENEPGQFNLSPSDYVETVTALAALRARREAFEEAAKLAERLAGVPTNSLPTCNGEARTIATALRARAGE